MSYLVDANILCEATQPQADTVVIKWLDRFDAELFVSVLTLGEIEKGIHLVPSSQKRRQLEKWHAELASSFEGRVLPIDQPVMHEWSRLDSKSQKSGHLLPSFDSLLAATATTHGLTIVTRNSADFPSDVKLVNPWK